jgi:hypothetical protein
LRIKQFAVFEKPLLRNPYAARDYPAILVDPLEGEMHLRIFAVATAAMLLLVPVQAQQSHWASADDQTAKYIVDMERK